MSDGSSSSWDGRTMFPDSAYCLRQKVAKAYHAYLPLERSVFVEQDSDRSDFRHVVYYDPDKLSTPRVLCHCTHTVLSNPLLWIESVGYLLAYALISIIIRTSYGAHKADLEDHEEHIRSHIENHSMLTAFMLSLYTSQCMARWWDLRIKGIGGMKAACSQLSVLVSTFVTGDKQVLSAIRRYARASLIMVFQQRDSEIDYDELEELDILTREESEKLQMWDTNVIESIWTWTLHIIHKLYKEGLVKSDQLYILLIEQALNGRSGAQTLCTFLTCQIPLPYFHYMTVLVKLHNLKLIFWAGFLAGLHSFDTFYLVPITLYTTWVVTVPFLFNAILFINADLSDPFDADEIDFPRARYQLSFENDGKSYIDAGKYVPEWIRNSGETRTTTASTSPKSTTRAR